jgi:hypothetical protein
MDMSQTEWKRAGEKYSQRTDNLYNNVYVFWLYVHNIVSVWSFLAFFFIS